MFQRVRALKGKSFVALWLLVIGICLSASYIMFLGFGKAIGNPFVTVLAITAIWIIGIVGLWTKLKRWGWMP
jgi:hypothetical protein